MDPLRCCITKFNKLPIDERCGLAGSALTFILGAILLASSPSIYSGGELDNLAYVGSAILALTLTGIVYYLLRCIVACIGVAGIWYGDGGRCC